MSNPSPLDSIVNLISTDVRMIRDFARETDQNLAAKSTTKWQDTSGLSKNDAEDLRRIAQALQESASLAESTSLVSGKEREVARFKVSDRVGEFVVNAFLPIKHRRFLAEMALSYLVSHFEAFIKDYVRAVLLAQPSMLKSSSTLTFEEAVNHRSIKQLRNALAEKEVEGLGYGSIDDISNYFLKKFSIDLARFLQWERLRESVYRRNLVIHNQSRVNSIYRRKVGYTGENLQLTTDMPYVMEVADILLAFIKHVHAELGPKIGQRNTLSAKENSSKRVALYVKN